MAAAERTTPSPSLPEWPGMTRITTPEARTLASPLHWQWVDRSRQDIAVRLNCFLDREFTDLDLTQVLTQEVAFVVFQNFIDNLTRKRRDEFKVEIPFQYYQEHLPEIFSLVEKVRVNAYRLHIFAPARVWLTFVPLLAPAAESKG